MNEESFEKLDQSMSDKFRGVRQKKVPPQILEGFSASVEERIRVRAEERQRWRFKLPLWIPSLVPVLAVLVIFVWAAVLRQPGERMSIQLPSNGALPVALSVAGNLSDEIAVLEELGVWTEEDDQSVDRSLVDF